MYNSICTLHIVNAIKTSYTKSTFLFPQWTPSPGTALLHKLLPSGFLHHSLMQIVEKFPLYRFYNTKCQLFFFYVFHYGVHTQKVKANKFLTIFLEMLLLYLPLIIYFTPSPARKITWYGLFTCKNGNSRYQRELNIK